MATTKTIKANYSVFTIETGAVLQNANGKKTAVVQGKRYSSRNATELIRLEVTDRNGAKYEDELTPRQLTQYFPVMSSLVRYEMTLTSLTAEQVEAIKALGIPALITQIA